MDAILPQIIGNLPDGGLYYALLFLISMAESIAIIGLAVPGSTLIVCAGFLSAHGQGHLIGVMTAAAAGALAGDICSYLMGSRLGYRFLQQRFFHKHLSLIRKAEMFFLDHGGKSLFLGRFAGPLRGLTPFIAGSAKLPPMRFLGYTLFSCALWGLAYPGVGNLGALSWRQVQVWSGRLSLLITTLVVVLFANTLFWSRLAPRLSTRLATLWQKLRQLWQGWLESSLPRRWRTRHPRLWQFAADRFSLRHGSGLYLTAAFCCCVLFAGLFFMLLVHLPFFEQIDHHIAALVARHHHPLAARWMHLCSGLADWQVLLLWLMLLLFRLLLRGRVFSAAILLIGLGGGQALVSLLKRTLTGPVPALAVSGPEFPSGHAFFGLLMAGLTVYLMLGTIRDWQSRLSLITSASFLALLIGISRIFIGADRLGDVLGGWLLAALWLSFLVAALEIRRRLAGENLWHRQWRAPGFNRRLERFFWAASAGLVLLGIIRHLWSLWHLG